MKDEYVIISKTSIQKRIEELETKRNSEHKKGHDKSALRYENTILELKQILSKSTPLIPEIEKAYNQGYTSCEEGEKQISKDYILNLNLNL